MLQFSTMTTLFFNNEVRECISILHQCEKNSSNDNSSRHINNFNFTADEQPRKVVVTQKTGSHKSVS